MFTFTLVLVVIVLMIRSPHQDTKAIDKTYDRLMKEKEELEETFKKDESYDADVLKQVEAAERKQRIDNDVKLILEIRGESND